MSIDYINLERPILARETYNWNPFIGYLSPKGNLIDFNYPFGDPGHDGWENIVTNTFLTYISFYIKNDVLIKGLDNCDDKEFDQLIKEIKDEMYWWNLAKNDNSTIEFKYQILKFFNHAYSSNNFFNSINEVIKIPWLSDMNGIQDLNNPKNIKLKKELLTFFKDIVVCYLGYDSIERFNPNGNLITIPHNPREYGDSYSYSFDSYFYRTPRIITTSNINIYERFYNFLLMDWKIHRVHKFVWNDNKQKYEKESQIKKLYYNEKEEVLKKEIKSIRRQIPINERYHYFR